MTLTAKLAAALALTMLLISSHWYAYDSGNENGTNAVLVGALTATNKAMVERNKENSILAAKYADLAQKASEDHANEIEAVKRTAAAHAGKRVQIDPGICRSAGEAEGVAPGSDGQETAGAAFLPEQFTSDLRQAAALADEITADFRTLVRRANESGCFQ